MTIRRGANLLELLPTAAAGLVPDPFVERLGFLTVVDHHASMGPGATVHTGMLQSLEDIFDIGSQSWDVRIPGLSTGLRFRLSVMRAGLPPQSPGGPTNAAGTNIPFVTEGMPTGFQLDILVGNLEVRFRGLRAATRIGGSGVSAAHLEPMVPPQDVWFVVSGAIQISALAGAAPQFNVIDSPDPLDPAAPNGAVIRMTANPPSFLFGNSKYGATLDRLVLDLSRTYTPPEIAVRHHGDDFMGVSFREAAFFLPPDTPVVGALSFTIRDLIMGEPFGLQGEAILEMGQEFSAQANGSGWMFGNAVIHDKLGNTLGAINGSGEKTLTAGPSPTPIKIVWFPDPANVPPSVNDRTVAGVWYQLPDGRKGVCAVPSLNSPGPMVSPMFDVPTTGELSYRVRVAQAGAPVAQLPASPDTIPAGQAELAEIRVRFKVSSIPAPARLRIDAQRGAVLENTACLVGRAAALAPYLLKLHILDDQGNVTDPPNVLGTAKWHIASGGVQTGMQTGAVFYITPAHFPSGAKEFDIVCVVPAPPPLPGQPIDPPSRRRVRIRIADVNVIVGCEGGPQAVDDSQAPFTENSVEPKRVVATELLDWFHPDGKLVVAPVTATINQTTPKTVTVPTATIAEVEIDTSGGGVIVVGTDGPRGLQLQMKFDDTTITKALHAYDALPSWARLDPEHPLDARGLAYTNTTQSPDAQPLPGSTDHLAHIQEWLKKLPGNPADRVYFVVGRTDDLCRHVDRQANDNYNIGLSKNRLGHALVELAKAGVPQAQTFHRIEQEAAWKPAPPPVLSSTPARIQQVGRLLPANSHVPGTNTWYYQKGTGNDFSPDHDSDDVKHNTAYKDTRRDPYRSVEIWAAIPGFGNNPQFEIPPTASQVHVLVPGADGPLPEPPISLEEAPPLDWRMRLRAKWDSPTVVSGDDGVPAEVEALFAWKKDEIALTGSNGQPLLGQGGQPLGATPQGDATYWEVLARFAYDVRTGITEVSGALTMPAGTLTISSDAVAGALALAPALGGLLDPTDAVNDTAGYFLKCAAIIAAGAAIGELINMGDGPESTVDLRRFEVRYRWDGQDQLRATMDYAVDLHVAVEIDGVVDVKGSVKLNYKNVGVAFAWDGNGLQSAGLCFDAVSIEVADMGSWSIDGPLGDLIRIAASRFGRGSTWAEFDLELALDLGVVRLESATIRLILAPSFGVELRGMKIGVKIENVLEGSGRLELGDGGMVRAGVACQVIPANLGAAGSLAIKQDFVAVEFKVSLPVGIPLANSGMAIYGFLGRFVANGARSFDGLPTTGIDPAMRELLWFQSDKKYAPQSGQYAVGLGAIIGTLPDNGFSFNAEGSLTIGFPDISVIFGIDAKFATQRSVEAAEKGSGEGGFNGRIIGLTVIDKTAVAIAIRADLTVPKLLKLLIPVSAYFPSTNASKWFIRIGTDNHADRPGDPVTLSLFPDDFDVKAWGFLMFEGDGLPELGGNLVHAMGNMPLDLSGFAIGFGCGFDVHWEAGPVHVDLSASLLLGLGTKPLLLVGQIQFNGEASIEIVSVAAYGYVQARFLDGAFEAHVHVCGKIDLLFDEVEECIDFDINPGATDTIPFPGSPIQGIDLCDHLAAVKGKAISLESAPPPDDQLPVVWPDAVAAIQFAHAVVDKVDDQPGQSVDILVGQAAGPIWFGSTELKYAYRLNRIEVWRVDGGTATMVQGPIDAAWWFPTHRAALITGEDDQPDGSPEEGRQLGLFWWNPSPWSRWLTKDNQSNPGYPTQTLEDLCDEAQPARPSCAFGRDAIPLEPLRATIIAKAKADAKISSKFVVGVGVSATADVQFFLSVLIGAGLELEPGGVTELVPPPLALDGEQLEAVWQLPAATDKGTVITTLTTELVPSQGLVDGEICLLACFEPMRTETTPHTVIADDCEVIGAAVARTIVEQRVSPNGMTFRGELSWSTADGLSARGIVHMMPPAAVDVFELDLEPGPGVIAIATDAAGNGIATASLRPGPRGVLQLRAAGITAVELHVSDTITIYQLCVGIDRALQVAKSADPSSFAPAGELPKVIGYHPDGSSQWLVGTIVNWRDEGGHRCALIRYPAPGALWTRFVVAPWTNGHLHLVSLCGVTETAVQIKEADEGIRADLVDLFRTGPGYQFAQSSKPVWLEPNATYEIRVGWQWQAWTPVIPGTQEPPPPGDGGWEPELEDRYRFRTAAYGKWVDPVIDPDAPPADPFPEDVFDPRGLSRYLMRMLPVHTDAPHFPSDSVGAWFNCNHVQNLLAKYGRELVVRITRTNPRADQMVIDPDVVVLPGQAIDPNDLVMPDAPCEVASAITDEPWFEVEAHMGDVLEALTCIRNSGNFGASTVTAWAQLETRADYDFLLVARELGGDAKKGDVVSRTHFRTSRYQNAEQLIRGLGLGLDEEFVGSVPDDAIITAPIPDANLIEKTDAGLDKVLEDIGIGPISLPSDGRTTLLWREVGGGWRLQGVLFESDEPIHRARPMIGFVDEQPKHRLTLTAVQVPEAAALQLEERARNAAGTRILWAVKTPEPLPMGRYTLKVTFQSNGSDLVTQAPLFDRPLVVTQEAE